MSRILVAEDSFALANLLNFVLTNSGFVVDLVRDGSSACRASSKQKYDVILLDQQMPHLTGLEVVEALRNEGPNLDTPVFLCTAKSHEIDADDVKTRLAVAEVFQKPFSPKELVARLKSFVPSTVTQ